MVFAVIMLFAGGFATPAHAQEVDGLPPELRAWLDDRGPLRVGWSAALRPVSIVEDGVVTGGYAVDAWDLAALRLGLDLEHVAHPDAVSLGAALAAGEIDVVGGLGAHRAVADGRHASAPYAWVPGVFVGRPEQAALGIDDLTDREFTTLPGAEIRNDVLREHPGGTFVPTDGPVDGLQAVAAGEIDLFFGPLALLGHQMARLELDLVTVGERGEVSTVQSWADVGSEAAAIADEVRASLTSSDLAVLHVRWTGFDLTEPGTGESIPAWLAPVGAGLVAVVVVLALFTVVLRRRVARATADLLELNGELEGEVAERTRALMMSNQALRRFASTAAHDLKGPLAAIAGLSELLATIALTDEQRTEMADRIRNSAARLSTMVGAMLEDASRVGVGVDSVEGSSFDSWLREVSGPELSVIDAELRVEVPDGPLDLDAEILRRTSLNLVGNAIKYATHELGTTIAVSLTRRDDDWELVVEDNGPGIPRAMWSEIFDRGSRLVHDDRGFGLGLSAIRDLVQGVGGSIRVGDSSVLGGAEFRVQLPMATTPAVNRADATT